MMKRFFIGFFLVLIAFIQLPAQKKDGFPWWKRNKLRVIQINLPDYEAATLNPDSLLADLLYYSANTLLINAVVSWLFIPPNWIFKTATAI